MPKKKIKVKAIVPKDLTTYSVSGFFGGLNDTEGIIKIFEDDLIPKVDTESKQLILDEVHRKFIAKLNFSPQVWKRMAYWMLKHVKEFEKKYGEIKVKHLSKETEVDYEFV